MTVEARFEADSGGDPYRAVPIPALARFVIAALWTAGVFWASGFVYALLPGHNLIPDLLFRVVACVLTAGGFVFFLRVLDYNRSPATVALGLPLDRASGENFAAGLALGALLIAGDVGTIACLGSLQFQLHLSLPMAVRAAAVAALLLFGALLEELSFRGYPFQKLAESCGAFWAVVVLSALFGALHLGNPDAGGWLSWGFFNTLAVGVLFALARIRSGSLWFSFGLHFGWNLFQGSVFGLPVSGLREFSTVVIASAHGSPALTGGAYGPEASATCSVVLIAGFPLVWWLTAS
jgi:membrane protease YdiL (CAAX protease family)